MQLPWAYKILMYLSIYSVFIPALVGLKKFKTLNKRMRVLFFYIIASALSDFISLYLAKKGISNYLVRNVYIMLIGFCISYIYYNAFNDKKIRIFILSSFTVFLFLYVSNFLIWGNLSRLDITVITVEAFFFILLAHFYTYYLFKEMNFEKLRDDAFFWVNNAFLIYFSGNFAIFLYFNYILNIGLELYYFLHSLQLLTNIAFNILLTIGLWKIKLQSQY